MSEVEHKLIKRSRITYHTSPFLASLFLFLLALIPRLPDLGRFLTADEFLWIDRSRNFLAGLTNPAYQCDSVVESWQFMAQGLACTLRTGHPGVTTMWTGSFGFLLRWLWDGRPGPLHDYVVAVATNPVDASFIAPERLGTVLLTSLWVVAVYWLARRLFGEAIALLGATLMALDPFHIALSRVIHHDALGTTFMTLSVLCAFIYWGEDARSQKSVIGFGDASPRPALSLSKRSPVPGHFFRDRLWLLLSGFCAGLAFLSKSPSLFLMPFIALTGLWFFWEGGRMKDEVRKKFFIPHPSSFILLISDGLLWFAVAIAIVFAFWPAMWVAPLETVQTVIFIGSKYATGGHAKGNFFLGEISQDPGALFYPVTWLYRTSPLVLAGVVSALIAWPLHQRKSQAGKGEWCAKFGESEGKPPTRPVNLPSSLFLLPPSPFPRYLPLILLFIVGFYLLMTIGEKKQDRYFLPVYPWLNLIAAAGLLWILDFRFWIYDLRFTNLVPARSLPVGRLTPHASRLTFYLLIILLQAALIFASFPYYFTYFNPLLGGLRGAAQAVTIGWGEGLDLAAAYLNEHTDPSRTRVASWYESTFAPFYHGDSISYSQEKGKALAGDYVVFYINQTQRRFPDEIMFDYFESRGQPEKVITLQGLDYAWIYPSLGIDHYIEDQTYSGIASLLAWQWTKGDAPLSPGRPAEFELYWEYLGKRPDEVFFFRLVDGQERLWAEGQSQPLAAQNPPPEKWRQGEIIVEHGALTPPGDMPPGQYQLQIGFYTAAPAVTSGELLFTLPITESLITVGHTETPTAYRLPANARPVDQPLGEVLTLLGTTYPPNLSAASPVIPLELYWRVEQPIPADFSLHVGLMNPGDKAQQAWFDLSLAETLHPADTLWQPGDIIRTSWRLDLLPDTPPGSYYFDLILPDSLDNGQIKKLSFGSLTLKNTD
ncbi:MAG: glycosyltransferase family 39 protein [Anaerolineae bacterium]|nr:glycosyltransferase family 39 protein [Anaerolineae bacterium]